MHSRLALAFAVLASAPAAAADVDFARDVLPILSDNCFHCHGPEETGRKAGLRLDTKDGAFKVKKGRAMLVPGKSGDSEVIRRVLSTDADEQMPPPDSNRKLTAKQAQTLKAWVDAGAKWGTHWAYTPPAAVGGTIDSHVRARLQKEGLKPAAAATRDAWLRRVSLDLTGLPPSRAEAEAFRADASPKAFEAVVDRLLASPRYGERMAADWLDVARYADTHGYQADRGRAMWAYRDWVVKAFNANLRYDQFATWQLAGDLLPNPTKDQRLATAFNRLHMQNEEGGVVEEEFRVAYVADRVNTFGTAFLAQTFECCRCHDHKYDPVSQKEYYQLFAFFQNVDEAGQTSFFTPAMPTPTLLLSTDEQDAKIAALAAAVTALEAALFLPDGIGDVAPAAVTAPVPVAAFAFDEIAGAKSPNGVDAKNPAVGHDGPKLVAGKVGKAVALTGEDGFTFPNVGHFTRSDPFSLSLWLKPPAAVPRAVVLHHSKAPIDAASRGYELLLEENRVAVGLHHTWPGNALKVVGKKTIPAGEWSHVVVRYDGSSRAGGVAVFVNGVRDDVEIVRDHLWKDITYDGGEPPLALGHRFRDVGFKLGAVDELKVFDRAVTAAEAAVLAGVGPTAADVRRHAVERSDAVVKRLAGVRAARAAHAKLVNPIPEAMVMHELPAARPAFVLTRGAYDAPGDAVTAGTPAVLPPLPAGPRNRLTLAKWLTSPGNPLFARVAVNRLWQQMFGRGVVETSDNFGTTGTPPSHPELLDFLAADFARDWDVKRVLKQIALSETYRQASAVTPELILRDPENVVLARGPARRLTAEMLRDQALFVGGLLVEKFGGPSVYPYQPDGLWNEAMGRPNYPRSAGPDLYRRSLYTYWKRTAPPPQMVSFDAADRSNCAVRRQATSTPLQALVLLNDPQYVEAARYLGQRTLKEARPTAADRSGWAFAAVAGRPATAKEVAVLARLYDEQLAEFAADPAAAAKLLAVGDSKPDATLPPAELAAATVLGLAVLNHDAAVFRR